MLSVFFGGSPTCATAQCCQLIIMMCVNGVKVLWIPIQRYGAAVYTNTVLLLSACVQLLSGSCFDEFCLCSW